MIINQIGNPALVKHSIVARSRKDLTRKMLMNNLKLGCQFDYQIMKDDNEWVAWFLKEIKIGDTNEFNERTKAVDVL